MNKALSLKNWKNGGRHYVLRATSNNKWVGFQASVIGKLKAKYGDDFFIVIWTERGIEDDFFKIPFRKVKHVFTEEHKTTGDFPDRWTAIISDGKFLMHSNSKLAVDIRTDYGNLHTEEEFVEGVREDLSSLEIENEYFEGERKAQLRSYYERNPKLRSAAIVLHGLTCKICGFNFYDFYGETGTGFIEVHHLKPVSSLKSPGKVNPGTDMTVVCSNCHRMLHRGKNSALTPAELRRILRRRENDNGHQLIG